MKIAIAGFGVEGRANYKYFRHEYPDTEFVIVDEREIAEGVPSGARVVSGIGAFEKLQDYDMVVRTAGLAPRKIKTDGKIWSATNEFFAKCPAPIIGVTGTKGKGTTCSLITSILRAAGKTVHLVGNIGVPALDILPNIQPDDIVVYELSSFQLWDLEKSPHVAVVLMIEPDHLDVHEDFQDYVNAKKYIARHQMVDDIVIFNKNNQYSQEIAVESAAKSIPYPFEMKQEWVDALQLPGAHNRDNAAAAVLAAQAACPGLTSGEITQGLQAFAGLPHRLKFVAEKGGVKYYDDSISTTPGSAIAALRSFDAPKVIILGGHDKGADYAEVVAECRRQDARIIAIGQTGTTIHELAVEQGVESHRVEGLMPEVVAKAVEVAPQGSVVLLSPASASFGQYENYADRGDKFVAAVSSLEE